MDSLRSCPHCDLLHQIFAHTSPSKIYSKTSAGSDLTNNTPKIPEHADEAYTKSSID